MVNKPKPQTLRERIEKSTTNPGQAIPDSDLDSDWQSHFNTVINTLGTIGPMDQFSLLDPESAKVAQEMITANLEKLSQVQKQVKAVNTLLESNQGQAKLAVDNLPWPRPEYSFQKKIT